ncbi:EAL domain-containing protein [Ramlibacter algicola]|uniref:EAL domain-containing response regulator n=1 Tax=Ramlibacter algicola TaxID=2795217 RepID=A0A934Q5L3_9BURK|nr:EAL domain-containing response regulator [Ramlibacter algicola]MBK0394892.1 EAL domain-containing response regulator [Ramlibacter algicola]
MPCSELRFLVVEDHEFQRAAMQRLLLSLGAEAVHVAEDGHTALRVLTDPDRPVDIVISDLSMPGMDGMELVRHLGESGSKVSLILASALDPALLSSIANMALAYKVRLLGVMGKPASAAKIMPMVEAHRIGISGRPEAEDSFPLETIAASWANNDFEPWFEPLVDFQTRKVCGLHAVPRWRHPERGLLDDHVFLPSIQARGLMEDFAWLMLQKSVARCRHWRARGLEAFVSVPLLFESWADVTLANRVRQSIRQADVEPRHVVLGLPEPAVDTDAARSLENLARLRVDGFGLALDNFGGGPLQVDRLALVAFTHLRVGPQFVRNVDRDDTARAGLAVALDLAAQLRLNVVATGIERDDEWLLLRDWGCNVGQGPGISPALPGDALLEWTRKWNSTAFLALDRHRERFGE